MNPCCSWHLQDSTLTKCLSAMKAMNVAIIASWPFLCSVKGEVVWATLFSFILSYMIWLKNELFHKMLRRKTIHSLCYNECDHYIILCPWAMPYHKGDLYQQSYGKGDEPHLQKEMRKYLVLFPLPFFSQDVIVFLESKNIKAFCLSELAHYFHQCYTVLCFLVNSFLFIVLLQVFSACQWLVLFHPWAFQWLSCLCEMIPSLLSSYTYFLRYVIIK